MKEISKREMEKLVDAGVLINTRNGFINRKGYSVSFYRSKHKRYIEDWYANKARQLKN